ASGRTFSDKSPRHCGKGMSDEEKIFTYNGVLYPSIMCPEETLKRLDSIQAREDDVMLVAYPKCGFNWMVGVLRKIIGEATGKKMDSKTPPLIEFSAPEYLKVIEQDPSPRLLGTHIHPDNIPASFFEKKTKMLVVFRNPKDTLVSFYHFYQNNPVLPSGQSWETFFSNFMSGEVAWGSYFEHAKAWEKRMDDPNIMVVTYEELKEDLSMGVRNISRFFGFQLTEEQVQQIAEGSTFRAMREKSNDSHAGMGKVFFRKGEVGDWKNNFTPEQSQKMDEVFKAELEGTRLGAKLNYQKYCQ
uniref:Sulfotransferase n=1 Tax=Mola mola TaxID=94237 RepID=A0A3Q4AYD4_MOLML